MMRLRSRAIWSLCGAVSASSAFAFVDADTKLDNTLSKARLAGLKLPNSSLSASDFTIETTLNDQDGNRRRNCFTLSDNMACVNTLTNLQHEPVTHTFDHVIFGDGSSAWAAWIEIRKEAPNDKILLISSSNFGPCVQPSSKVPVVPTNVWCHIPKSIFSFFINHCNSAGLLPPSIAVSLLGGRQRPMPMTDESVVDFKGKTVLLYGVDTLNDMHIDVPESQVLMKDGCVVNFSKLLLAGASTAKGAHTFPLALPDEMPSYFDLQDGAASIATMVSLHVRLAEGRECQTTTAPAAPVKGAGDREGIDELGSHAVNMSEKLSEEMSRQIPGIKRHGPVGMAEATAVSTSTGKGLVEGAGGGKGGGGGFGEGQGMGQGIGTSMPDPIATDLLATPRLMSDFWLMSSAQHREHGDNSRMVRKVAVVGSGHRAAEIASLIATHYQGVNVTMFCRTAHPFENHLPSFVTSNLSALFDAMQNMFPSFDKYVGKIKTETADGLPKQSNVHLRAPATVTRIDVDKFSFGKNSKDSPQLQVSYEQPGNLYNLVTSRGVMGPNETNQTLYFDCESRNGFKTNNGFSVTGPNTVKSSSPLCRLDSSNGNGNGCGASGPNANLDNQYMNDAGSKQQVYFDLVVHAPDHVQPMELSIAGLDLPAQLHIEQSMILKEFPESTFFVDDSLQVPTKGHGGNVFAAGPAAQFFEPLSRRFHQRSGVTYNVASGVHAARMMTNRSLATKSFKDSSMAVSSRLSRIYLPCATANVTTKKDINSWEVYAQGGAIDFEEFDDMIQRYYLHGFFAEEMDLPEPHLQSFDIVSLGNADRDLFAIGVFSPPQSSTGRTLLRAEPWLSPFELQERLNEATSPPLPLSLSPVEGEEAVEGTSTVTSNRQDRVPAVKESAPLDSFRAKESDLDGLANRDSDDVSNGLDNASAEAPASILGHKRRHTTCPKQPIDIEHIMHDYLESSSFDFSGGGHLATEYEFARKVNDDSDSDANGDNSDANGDGDGDGSHVSINESGPKPSSRSHGYGPGINTHMHPPGHERRLFPSLTSRGRLNDDLDIAKAVGQSSPATASLSENLSNVTVASVAHGIVYYMDTNWCIVGLTLLNPSQKTLDMARRLLILDHSERHISHIDQLRNHIPIHDQPNILGCSVPANINLQPRLRK